MGPLTTNSAYLNATRRPTQTVIPLEFLPSDMDSDTRQKLISLFLVLLMVGSGLAYTISLI